MKNSLGKIILSSVLCAVSIACAATPSLEVTVSDASGKPAFKGKTNANGTFATGNLQPGKYTVQFKGSDASLKGHQFFVAVSAGTKKASNNAVAGEKFGGGGVAMKVDVATASSITGQVGTSNSAPVVGAASGLTTKVKYENGKKYVWLPPETGSHFGGRWVPADEVDVHSTGVQRTSAAAFEASKDSHGR